MAISAIKLKNGRICGPVPGAYTGPMLVFLVALTLAQGTVSTSDEFIVYCASQRSAT